jgi:diguanylate cyclase (GGDEF)-like protein
MNKTSIIKVLKNVGTKQLIAFLLAIILAGGAIGYLGSVLYKSVSAELKLRGEMDVIESSDRFSQYLIFDKNALKVAGYAVNNMLIHDASNKAILTYMEDQSERMKNALDKSFTGLYGYINGEYLDGAGWVPDKDYVPTERPWYKAAINHPNETVYVDPYVDQQTGKVMITIAELLDDGKSVIALDIGLDGVQKITDDIAKDTPGATVIVLDSGNVAIAHSKSSEVGKDYSDKKNKFGNMIVRGIHQKEENSFSVKYNDQSYMVFSKEIEGGWHCASVIDTRTFYRPLVKVIIATAIIGLIALILILLIFFRLSFREMTIRKMHVQIKAAADVYEYFLDIYLDEDSYYSLRNRKNPENNDSEYKNDAQKTLYRHADIIIDDGSKPYMKEFIDLSTLRQRLAEKDVVSAEFMNRNQKWYRARFISAERLPEGDVTRVLLGVESIDDEKQEKEYLRHLAETDLMTGINNRVTGEYKIKTILGSGRGGMFVLFDIDRFKKFNDRFGHTVGDKVIISVVNCLKNSFRNEDVVMRLGGDEFAAFAVGVHDKQAGERIMARFYDNLDHVVISEAEGEKISASASAAFCPDDDAMSFKELYEAADQCMYESKKTYNNKVTFHE